MSESNDTLSALLTFAVFLHSLTLLGMALHTALLPDTPAEEHSQDRTLKALLLGRAPIQRTAYSRTNSRLLTGSALLLATASAMSLGQGPPRPGPRRSPCSPCSNLPAPTPGTSPAPGQARAQMSKQCPTIPQQSTTTITIPTTRR